MGIDRADLSVLRATTRRKAHCTQIDASRVRNRGSRRHLDWENERYFSGELRWPDGRAESWPRARQQRGPKSPARSRQGRATKSHVDEGCSRRRRPMRGARRSRAAALSCSVCTRAAGAPPRSRRSLHKTALAGSSVRNGTTEALFAERAEGKRNEVQWQSR